MTETPLDRAWSATESPTAGDAEMARFYDTFAAAELHLLVDQASIEGDGVPQPLTFPVDGVDTALVFDTAERMASFTEDGAAHLTLSGRAVIEMFAGSAAQLGVNLGDAPSVTILPPSALAWAADALRQPIEADTTAEATLTVPRGAMPTLLMQIDAKLAGMGGGVAEAWLCGLGAGGGRGRPAPLILCVVLRAAEAETAVVSALAETARFAGGERAAYDIAVMGPGDPRLEAARKVGLGFEPARPEVERADPAPPGSDPKTPPRLR